MYIFYQYFMVKLMKKETLIILFSPSEWLQFTRRPHWQPVNEYCPLLIIEPPVGIIFLFLHIERFFNYLKYGHKIRKNENGILFYRPFSLGTYGVNFRIPLLAKLDRLIIGFQLNHLIKKQGFNSKKLITYINKVQQYNIVDCIKYSKILYEVTDEYRVREGDANLIESNPYTEKMMNVEKYILDKAHLVIASSKKLHQSKLKYNKNTFYISNSADFKHFYKSTDSSLPIPVVIDKISKPILGYIGNINEIIDIELLCEIAQNRPTCSIVLIGKINGRKHWANQEVYGKLLKYRNIHYLGFKKYSDLPRYLKAFDVCLMPFRDCEWMRNASPNKTYQYLSSGKPVVSTYFPEVEGMEDVIYICNNHDSFLGSIDISLNENNRDIKKMRIMIAQNNSTEKRAKKVIDLLREVLLD